jgi:hypothetical protein
MTSRNLSFFQAEEEKRSGSASSTLDSSDIFGQGKSPTMKQIRRLAEMKVGTTNFYKGLTLACVRKA